MNSYQVMKRCGKYTNSRIESWATWHP